MISAKNLFFNRFDLLQPIDSGRFGTVYLCYNRLLDKQFACKKLPIYRQDLIHNKNINMLNNEISNLKRLRGYPHIARLVDAYREPDDLYLVMDLYSQDNIKNMMNKSNSEIKVAKIAAHLALALSACHDLNIVHNDVKPSNLLFDGTDYRLTDFGASFNADLGNFGSVGTPWYFSLEKFNGTSSFSSDIFALGVLVYLLINNAHPFIKQLGMETSCYDIYSALNNRNPIVWHSQVSNECKEFIESCLLLKKLDIDHPFIKPFTNCFKF
jgi:serine/threonine-protein kinase